MSRIIEAMLSMIGRVTMLGNSRWAGKDVSYRTVQRFFNSAIHWAQVFCIFFSHHLVRPEGEYLLVGDESVITKSGEETYGLGRFFSGVHNKMVKSIAIFSISLVDVDERYSYPLRIEQVVSTEASMLLPKPVRKRNRTKKSLPNRRKSVVAQRAVITGIKPKLN